MNERDEEESSCQTEIGQCWSLTNGRLSADIECNSDTSPAIFKFESLSKGSKMSIIEMLGWVLFGFLVLLFIIPVIRVINKIKKRR